MRLLIIGINIRHIACSAWRAGHEVYAVDGYCDLDLESCACDMAPLSRDGMEGPKGEGDPVSEHIERVRPDAIILGPGLEEVRVRGVPLFNNSPDKVRRISDKLWQARWLERNGFPFIRTEASAEGLDFPVMIKPRRGAGGVGCRVARTRSELDWGEGLIYQEVVAGRPASVSVISDGKEARALAANEQLIGESWTGAAGFRYCGNITPLEPHPESDIAGMAEGIVSRLGLVGSNGVDFLLTQSLPGSSEFLPGSAARKARHHLLCWKGDPLRLPPSEDQREAAFSLDGRRPPPGIESGKGRSLHLRPGQGE